MSFVHLRTSSYNSVSEGILSPKQIIELAKANGQNAVAITDNCKTIGVIEHYMKAKEKGLKPIIGVDIYVEPDVTNFAGADFYKTLLIATDNQSYKNMLELVSRAWLENQVNGKPAIKQSWLKENPEYTKGLICLTGTFKESEIAQKTLAVVNTPKNDVTRKAKYTELEEAYKFYKEMFGSNLYLEIQRIGFPQEDDIIRAMLKSSVLHGIPMVATNPVEFGRPEDFVLNEIKVCDQNSSFLFDVYRPDYAYPDQYFKSEEDMAKTFKGLEFALENTQAVVDKCNVEIELHHNYLPTFEAPTGENEIDYFKRLSHEGFEAKMLDIFPNENERRAHYQEYLDRLEMEIECIIKMGFPGYFLIVQDFIRWSKDNNIPVGPGRGSGAGSLVAYALGITDIDPIKNALFFERFLNPERVSMPDFDIDFSKDRRDRVLEYVKEKYGADHVSQILTSINTKPKALLKMIGRSLNISHYEVEKLTKTITNAEALRDDMTVAKLYETNESFRETVDDSEDLQRIYHYAKDMDTMPKSLGQHAAGVIIAGVLLKQFASLHKTNKTPTVVQLDKKYAETAGLVKFDFLGLQTLDFYYDTVADIYKHTGKKIDIEKIDLNDPEVIENIFAKGNAFGVFQFEGKGMQRWVMESQPKSFEDLVAMTALYRPGPMQSGMLESFIKRKLGLEPIYYPDPDYQLDCLKPILANTYGTIVYQEQVMQAAQAIAGYSLGQADLLRRAMGKKDAKEMERQREAFKQGAIKNGHDGEIATKIFDIIEKFAGYGFNKSHSVAYTVISMRTAYLKHHYPEFYLTNVLNGKDDTDARNAVLEDMRKNGITVVAPDINLSDYKPRAVPKEKKVIYGFSGIKSVGVNGQKIAEEREKNGKFTSFVDFYERCFEFVDKKMVEQLIKSGAFDSIYANQGELLANLDTFNKLANAKRSRKQKTSVTNAILTGKKTKKPTKAEKSFSDLEWITTPFLDESEKVKNEFDAFGFNFQLDPFQGHLKDLGGLKALSTMQEFKEMTFKDSYSKVNMAIGGVIMSIREHSSGGKFIEVLGEAGRDGKIEDAFRDTLEVLNSDGDIEEIEESTENLEDEDNVITKRTHSFFLNKDLVSQFRKKLKENTFVMLEGSVTQPKVGNERYGNSFWVENIYTKAETEEKLVNGVNILTPPSNPDAVLKVLEKYPGRLPVTIWLPSKNGEEIFGALVDKKYFISNNADCFQELRNLLGQKAVSLTFKEKLIIEEKNNFRRNYR